MFRWYTNEFKYNLRGKLDISKIIDIFTCEDTIRVSSHVRISYHFLSICYHSVYPWLLCHKIMYSISKHINQIGKKNHELINTVISSQAHRNCCSVVWDKTIFLWVNYNLHVRTCGLTDRGPEKPFGNQVKKEDFNKSECLSSA